MDAVAAAGREALLEVRGLTLRFGGVRAISDVSFDVIEHELLALIGPNGAGKTSIFNCLTAVYQPHSGTIRLAGADIASLTPPQCAALGIARTFQNLGLFLHLNVIDNLMLGRHLKMKAGFLAGALWFGRARSEEAANREHCEELIELLGLGRHRYRPVGLLPYGVQKRIELGRALAMEPRLLLLDEPVAGMNADESEAMARCILELKRKLGMTVMLVEHDMHMVMQLADRVVVLDFGSVVAAGSPETVGRDPKVIQAYLGTAH